MENALEVDYFTNVYHKRCLGVSVWMWRLHGNKKKKRKTALPLRYAILCTRIASFDAGA